MSANACIIIHMDKLVKQVNSAISQIGRGNKNALGTLYELTSGYLLNMARVYVYDKSYAEDVVSEVYLKVVRNAQSFDTSKNGLNWLFKITKNTAINHNAYAARRSYTDIDARGDIADVFNALDDFNLFRGSLKDAVAHLTPEERRIIYLRYWEGYTVREIAKALGKPTMTMQDTIKKILKKLEKKI